MLEPCAGASSTTGIGEIAIRLVLAKSACNLMQNGKTAKDAARKLDKTCESENAERVYGFDHG